MCSHLTPNLTAANMHDDEASPYMMLQLTAATALRLFISWTNDERLGAWSRTGVGGETPRPISSQRCAVRDLATWHKPPLSWLDDGDIDIM